MLFALVPASTLQTSLVSVFLRLDQLGGLGTGHVISLEIDKCDIGILQGISFSLSLQPFTIIG